MLIQNLLTMQEFTVTAYMNDFPVHELFSDIQVVNILNEI